MTKKERAKSAVELLAELYPEAICSLEYNKEKPYEPAYRNKAFRSMHRRPCEYCHKGAV